MVSDETILIFFSNESLCTHMIPGEGHVCPTDVIQKKRVEVYKVMLHTKYEGSMPCGFRREDFFMLSPYTPL